MEILLRIWGHLRTRGNLFAFSYIVHRDIGKSQPSRAVFANIECLIFFFFFHTFVPLHRKTRTNLRTPGKRPHVNTFVPAWLEIPYEKNIESRAVFCKNSPAVFASWGWSVRRENYFSGFYVILFSCCTNRRRRRRGAAVFLYYLNTGLCTISSLLWWCVCGTYNTTEVILILLLHRWPVRGLNATSIGKAVITAPAEPPT